MLIKKHLSVLGLIVLLLSCGKSDSGYNSGGGGGGGGGTTNEITMSGSAFSPSSKSIKIGTTITWKNNDGDQHTVTSDNGGFTSSSTLNPGENFSYTFNNEGSFPYHCEFHDGMKGTITVTRY